MLAQGTGTPGISMPMALGGAAFRKEYPIHTLQDGDSLISNDPWQPPAISTTSP